MKLIYENDIPEVEEYWCNRWECHRKPHRNDERTGRWKPNGITDNRKEWHRKNDQRKGIEQLAEISNKGFTL